jgi:hypothetical protein
MKEQPEDVSCDISQLVFHVSRWKRKASSRAGAVEIASEP